jgi:hypothetical protein
LGAILKDNLDNYCSTSIKLDTYLILLREEIIVSSGKFTNPFRPGAGHRPPYLAGREKEKEDFLKLLSQEVILENLVLTGLRGVGKTVLLEEFKPLAIRGGWLWVGTDLSEAASLSDERIALRLLTDLSVVTSTIVVQSQDLPTLGFARENRHVETRLNYPTLMNLYQQTPGLVSDKLKGSLEFVWQRLKTAKVRGIVFAYDEAQNLNDHADRNEYPLSLVLDVFQSLQRKDIPFLLVLVGLPTLFPKLVEARTFAERMFRVVFLDRLNDEDSRDAITKPIGNAKCPVRLTPESIQVVVDHSGGYPYFIQFICREVYDVFVQLSERGEPAMVPLPEITRKLDTDFFAGRWARVTDRQRDLLVVIAHLENCADEFTVQEIVEKSKEIVENTTGVLHKPFSASHISQLLNALAA